MSGGAWRGRRRAPEASPAQWISSSRHTRPASITTEGESYQDVVERTAAWLADVMPQFTGRRLLVVGHRATFYAFEHLLRHVPLDVAVSSAWHWQPGWAYRARA